MHLEDMLGLQTEPKSKENRSMPRKSQTETAVLGGLSVEPMTGYALREAIRDVLGHFWSESFGQIYPTLRRLKEQGLIDHGESPNTGRATYMITEPGRRHLRERLRESIQPSAPRNGLLLRLFFGRELGPATCKQLVDEARSEAEARLESFVQLREELALEVDTGAQKPYTLLTISAGEHSARATLAWADEALAALDQIDKTERREG
jgi:DNA-binding PadR family transcriptional regulator